MTIKCGIERDRLLLSRRLSVPDPPSGDHSVCANDSLLTGKLEKLTRAYLEGFDHRSRSLGVDHQP